MPVSYAFARFDGDKDGKLNMVEAQNVFAAVGLERDSMADAFQQMDTDDNGKISMEEWEFAGNIHPPLAIRITTFDGIVETRPMESADFGPDFRHTPGLTFRGIIAVADPVEACEPLVGHYADKIVLAKRGACEFCAKAMSAQAAGAKAVMIANIDETVTHMTMGTCGQDVTIPSVMVPFSVGEELQGDRYLSSYVVFPTCMSAGPMKPGFGLEECDDGNTVSGDGCSPECMSECGNAVTSDSEECGDGNRLNYDGCSSECKLEQGLYHCSDPAGCHTECGDGFAVTAGCFLSGVSKSFSISPCEACCFRF